MAVHSERSYPSERRFSRRGGPPVLGIDLGATKVVSALVDARGAVLAHSGRHLHANDGPGGVLRSLAISARVCLREAPVAPTRVGIGVAAQVDPSSGTVVHAPNLGWRDVPLARRVADELGIASVSVVNDARAATYAEWRYGAGQGVDDLFGLFFGTGVGGSAVLGGRLVEGVTHAAGEVGHLTIVSGGRKCHCPSWGCFEAYVGGWAIGERTREAVWADRNAGAGLLALTGGSVETITAETLFRAYRGNDPLARRIVRETERYLADGVVSVVNAFNPAVVVLGGGLLSGLPELPAAARNAIRARCQPPAALARVVPAHFGENAVVVGAAALARDAAGRPRDR